MRLIRAIARDLDVEPRDLLIDLAVAPLLLLGLLAAIVLLFAVVPGPTS